MNSFFFPKWYSGCLNGISHLNILLLFYSLSSFFSIICLYILIIVCNLKRKVSWFSTRLYIKKKLKFFFFFFIFSCFLYWHSFNKQHFWFWFSIGSLPKPKIRRAITSTMFISFAMPFVTNSGSFTIWVIFKQFFLLGIF